MQEVYFKTEIKAEMQQFKSEIYSMLHNYQSSTDKTIAEIKSDIRLLKWMRGLTISGIMALVLKAFF